METDSKIKDDDEAKMVFDWLKHEDTLFGSRTTSFLSVQALLFGALVATGNSNGPLTRLQPVIIMLGVVSAVFWALVMAIQLGGTINEIKKKFRDYAVEPQAGSFFKFYAEISKNRRFPYLSINAAIGTYIPVIFLFTWFIAACKISN